MLDSIGWAAAFIWAGIVLFLAINLGYSDEQGWALFFLGAGMLVLIKVAVRLLVPVYHIAVFGDLIRAGILFGLGTGWGLIWPLILIVIGVSKLKGINSSHPKRSALKLRGAGSFFLTYPSIYLAHVKFVNVHDIQFSPLSHTRAFHPVQPASQR